MFYFYQNIFQEFCATGEQGAMLGCGGQPRVIWKQNLTDAIFPFLQYIRQRGYLLSFNLLLNSLIVISTLYGYVKIFPWRT
jgi:hypothetical protein